MEIERVWESGESKIKRDMELDEVKTETGGNKVNGGSTTVQELIARARRLRGKL